MSTDDPKRNRTVAKSRFTRYGNNLKRCIADNENLEIINEQYSDFISAWNNVENKHEHYIATTTDDQEGETWIEGVEETFNGIRTLYIKHKMNVEDGRDVMTAFNLREIFEKKFREQVLNLEYSVNKNYHRETVLREWNLVSKIFEELQSAHNKLTILKKTDEDKSLEMWYSKLYTEFGRINKLIDTFLHPVGANTESKVRSVLMEKIPLPKFDGNIRNYPRFLKDFKEVIMPNLKAIEAPFTLRQCLSEGVQSELSVCDDSLEEMLLRLNEKFANPSKLVDCIVSEIQKFRKIEIDDNRRIIAFVDIIDRGYRDLSKLKLEQEMCNSHITGIIEGKLPKNIQSEWYRMIHKEKIQIHQKFQKLLDFLRIERSALEYGMSELRTNYERKPANVNSLQTNFREMSEICYERKPAHVNSLQNNFREPNEICCLIHNGNHKTETCKTYMSMTIHERYELLKRHFACFCCLTPNHRAEFCPVKRECGNGCSKMHHRSLHPSSIDASCNCSLLNDCPDNSNKNVILPIMKIEYEKNQFINVLWDTAANLSLITKEKAKTMKLKGKPIELSVTVAGGEKNKIDSEIYTVPLIDMDGNKRYVIAYGIERITNKISSFNEKQLLNLFSGIDVDNISRPTGEVELLIGYEYANWHPIKERSREHLLILKNEFGRCFGGSHTWMQEGTQRIVNNASINFIYKSGFSSDFFTLESMGTNCTPSCGGCKCGKCPVGSKPYTIKEERELHQIESGLTFHNDHWVAKYPWDKDPNLLPDNYRYALKTLVTTENRLKRDVEWQEKYSEQVRDMVNRKVARKLDSEELRSYNGPVHYIAHHAVVKDSKSTPIRIVFNSSASFNGHVLNNYWVKGPDAYMNNLLGVLLRFRENYIGIVGDIRKMYNSVRTSTLDQHCHRFLWREMDISRPPDVYIITAVNIGDKPSGTIATVALHKTAEMAKNNYPYEVDIIKNSSYVDDILDSVGSKIKAEEVTKNIDAILKVGNFNMKKWTISESSAIIDEKSLLTDTHERVLGVCWAPRIDKLKFNIRINFSKKIRGHHSEADLLPEDIPKKLPVPLTKRLVLSQINGIYDPLGLVSPFIVKAKIYLRKLWAFEPKLDWDDEIPQPLLKDWIAFFQESFSLSDLLFRRCVKPINSVEEPTLISFSDASKAAFGACIYLRWKLSDNSYESNLLISKGRIAPLKSVTIVSLELSAAVLACRLRKFVENECRFKFSQFVHIIDSEIVRSMIQKESYGFNTLVATRIGEIQEASDPDEWFWIDGSLNIADIMTRGVNPNKLGSKSIWQQGPDFMRLPLEEWPIRNETLTFDLPERIQTVTTTIKNEYLIDISRFSNYDKLIRTTARILSVKEKDHGYSLRRIGDEVTSHAFRAAELYWTAEAQKEVLGDLKLAVNGKGRYKRLSVKMRADGIYTVGGRIEIWDEMSYNKMNVPILPRKHRISELYAENVHRLGHFGISTEIAKIRTKFWIVALERIVRSIRFNCVSCKKRDKKLASQVMSPLPLERLKPAPVWSSTGIDLFGPFQIRGEVNKRSTGKCYGVIFTCLLVRAVHLELAVDYSTEGFLMAFRRFTAIRGFPNKVYSDGGSQLVRASSELKNVFKELDWNRIKAFGANKNLEWVFSPGDSPWYNGCCEGLIRSIKKSIHHAIGQQRISYSELHTVLCEVSNLINARPIGRKPTEMEEGSYLCPNDLLLGRSSGQIPYQQFQESVTLRKRYAFVQLLVDVFWKKWTTFYFPSLIIQSKWHHERRNMQVGDIVLIQDSNNFRGQWKLGRISETYPGIDSKVRRVTVQYKLPNHNSFTNIERSVQRLVLVVPIDEI